MYVLHQLVAGQVGCQHILFRVGETVFALCAQRQHQAREIGIGAMDFHRQLARPDRAPAEEEGRAQVEAQQGHAGTVIGGIEQHGALESLALGARVAERGDHPAAALRFQHVAERFRAQAVAGVRGDATVGGRRGLGQASGRILGQDQVDRAGQGLRIVRIVGQPFGNGAGSIGKALLLDQLGDRMHGRGAGFPQRAACEQGRCPPGPEFRQHHVLSRARTRRSAAAVPASDNRPVLI